MSITRIQSAVLAMISAVMVMVLAGGQGSPIHAFQASADKGVTPAATPRQLFTIDHSELAFGQVALGSTSTVHSLKIMSADGSPVNIHSAAAGEDFRLDPSDCKVDAVTICRISVTFAPQHLGPSEPSLTITGTNSTGVSSVQPILLKGESTDRCNAGLSIFAPHWFESVAPAFLVVALFLLGIIVVRWNMVALPNKRLLRSQIDGVMAEVATLAPTPLTPRILPQVGALLTAAERPFVNSPGRVDRVADYFFWTRGEEISAWVCIHQAEELLVDLLPEERVRVRLERAEQELRRINGQPAVTLADRIREVLAPLPGAPPAAQLRSYALLHEALSIVYDSADRDYTGFMSWQNKTVWLIGCGLLFIVSLAATLQHGVLLLVGAVGGLLSRLSRSLQRADVPTDYGASWTTLFLSPVVGALAGWSGVLLVIIGVQLNVLGPVFAKVDWCNPWSPLTLGIAFLLGFSERAFNGVLTQLEEKTVAQARANPPAAPPAPNAGVAPPPPPVPLDPGSVPSPGGGAPPAPHPGVAPPALPAPGVVPPGAPLPPNPHS